MPSYQVCALSINHSGRQVAGRGLCSCGPLQVGVGGKDQAQLSNIMCTEEVKEAHCCVPQKCRLLLGQGPAGTSSKTITSLSLGSPGIPDPPHSVANPLPQLSRVAAGGGVRICS